MKTLSTTGFFISATTAVFVLIAASIASAQDHMSFSSADEAVTTLITALEKDDVPTLAAILGPGSEDILSSGDEIADANARADFLARYKTKHELLSENESTRVLQVGDNDWPFPVPIVATDGKWYFDGAAGADEVIYRRVGRNELGAIAVSRGFVDAEIEYAAQGHDGNEPGLFAAKLRSDPNQHNGLYWPGVEGEAQSPIGPAVARAAAEGYKAATGKPKPYHGYYYRMLYAQGANANGGEKEYFVEGMLTGGIALVAWPADYGSSGVMSFIVNQEGVVYQKDLGEDTSKVVGSMQVYDPDSSWSIVAPEDDI